MLLLLIKKKMEENEMKVKVTCYGKTEEMDREEAMKIYFEGMMCCEGAERDRYAKIYMELCDGLTEVSDEYND